MLAHSLDFGELKTLDLFNLLNVSQFFGDCTWGFLLLVSLAFADGDQLRAIFGLARAGKPHGGEPGKSGSGGR